MHTGHESVLFQEVMDGLEVAPNDVVVDATVGGAGHFTALMQALGADGVLIGIDEDQAAIERAREAVALDRRAERPRVHLVTDNFRNLDRVLSRLEVGEITKALFDLGWSGFQLSDGRGFSFQGDEPLLMTYGHPEAGTTAAEIVNTLGEAELADLIYAFGEERFARRIAKAIVTARKAKRITSTAELVAIIESGVPAAYRKGRIHPATKTFQALRIAVNDEFGAIKHGLSAAIGNLGYGGRIAVITFHSIEDRLVKSLFQDAVRAGKGVVVTKKVITASREEVLRNPRARSAKLRLFKSTLPSPVAELAVETIAYA
ncbi:MAG TPA: 16S rRNA (cytosine(1402)-N(4))-methyltransferase RsmH [Candidatus Paceibacterota bacterium]|nr:16S rRNA (cytosine(1402)-N(4))-methyltransferase RsmH [Candidatus Paceibacterota bacterium]